ncbi:UV-stimulated scaffold protein A like protein [Argiope bruennichi]|uniref:UV-stimulated scaffold protein A like protein n=1 Tax=Argiope bruennichi TaxID=94029 RepID=A0A8T0EI83_ARGBR|nr:UV-stimulated scaffold protein A like protein [Argiope bruennichi]
MAADKESEIPRIIEKLTTTGKKTLDEDLMKKLKSICKASDRNVNYCYYALMTQLRKEHSEIRYSVLLIINELFCRSSVFKKLLIVDFEEFLELVVESNPEKPLPLPQPRAKEMKIKGLEFIQMWTNKFGEKYTRLQLALKFLQNCKKVDFNDMEARNVAQRERHRQEQERLERILNERISKIQSEMIDVSDEISNILMQMENCFRLLVPHPTEDLFSNDDFESDNNLKSIDEHEIEPDISDQDDEPSTSNSLRQHGIYDMKNTITIEVKDRSAVAVKANEDTIPIIDNLNDLQKQMSSRYYPLVTNWLKTLTKGSNCTDTLKKAIDLKNLMESALQKYRELNIKADISKCDDEEDDDFVEVKDKDGYEEEPVKAPPVKKISEPSCSRELSSLEKAYMWKLKHSEDDVNDPTSAASTLSKRVIHSKTEISSLSESMAYFSETKDEKTMQKSKLLEKAPVLPYDIDLYHWEEEKLIVPERINGKFEPVKWSCRAPLPSGKLCPRRDRYKCPFHGKIIKRDNAGNPVDTNDGAGPSTSTPSGRETTKKILKRYKHYAKKLDDIERKKFNDKFGDQWNYY